jgi:hypothetical protein
VVICWYGTLEYQDVIQGVYHLGIPTMSCFSELNIGHSMAFNNKI